MDLWAKPWLESKSPSVFCQRPGVRMPWIENTIGGSYPPEQRDVRRVAMTSSLLLLCLCWIGWRDATTPCVSGQLLSELRRETRSGILALPGEGDPGLLPRNAEVIPVVVVVVALSSTGPGASRV